MVILLLTFFETTLPDAGNDTNLKTLPIQFLHISSKIPKKRSHFGRLSLSKKKTTKRSIKTKTTIVAASIAISNITFSDHLRVLRP